VLLEKCAQTERFADLQLSHDINRIEFSKAEQFPLSFSRSMNINTSSPSAAQTTL